MRIFILAGFAALALAQRTPMKPEDVAAGRQLYRNSCAGCHGLTGEGGRGPNLMGGRAVSRSSDEALFQSLKFGLAGTDMPPTKLPDEKLWQILAFVRGLSAPAYEIPVEGDDKAGAAIYFGKGGCTRCHAIAGRGGVSGPDLTSIGHQRPLNLLREAVLDPGKRVAPGYQQATLHLRSGRTLSGVLRDYTTYTYTLQDDQGELHFVKAADVTDSRLLPGTPMPGDYSKTLTADERRDLIKFLSRQSARGEQ
jgi:putative heme-binding domain-containing protein